MIGKIPLEGSRWKSLKSYGDSSEIPSLIRELHRVDNPGTMESLSDLQDCIYQQYVGSEAAYAVIPWLVEIGSHLRSTQDPYIWILIGHIAATSNVVQDPAPRDLLPDFRSALLAAEPFCLKVLLNGAWDLTTSYYLAVAAIAMAGNSVGKLVMDNLSPKSRYGESFANCPGCSSQLKVAFFDDGLAVYRNSTPVPPQSHPPEEPRRVTVSKRSPNPWIAVTPPLQRLIQSADLPGALPHLKTSLEISGNGVSPDVPPGFAFSLVGSLIGLKGYSKPAMRYFHAWDKVICPRCGSPFAFADHWWAWEPRLGWVSGTPQVPA